MLLFLTPRPLHPKSDFYTKTAFREHPEAVLLFSPVEEFYEFSYVIRKNNARAVFCLLVLCIVLAQWLRSAHSSHNPGSSFSRCKLYVDRHAHQ